MCYPLCVPLHQSAEGAPSSTTPYALLAEALAYLTLHSTAHLPHLHAPFFLSFLLTLPPTLYPQIIGFFHGYFEQSFFVTFYWWLGGSILAALLCIPSWPFLFQRDKVEWQPSLEDEAASDTTANAASTTSSSSSSSSTGAAAAATEVVAPNNKLEGKGSGKKR